MRRQEATRGKREAQFQQRIAGLRDAQAFHNDAQRVEGAKQEIAFAASKLLEAPEENLAQLRFLLELGLDGNVEVRRRLHPVSGVCWHGFQVVVPVACFDLGTFARVVP